jgi:hypothetical protein
MSHIVAIQTKLHDAAAITAACQRLNLAAPTEGTTRLYSGEASGLIVKLPEWHFPIVIDTLTGTVKYDNFNGIWGTQEHLSRFLQMYAVEKVKLESRKKGYSISESTLQDGSVKLQIIEGS